LATQMVKEYPDLQHICDYVGGCQNVTIICTKYDNTGNSELRGLTVWHIDTGDVDEGTWTWGVADTPNDKPNNHEAIQKAIRSYWMVWRLHQQEGPLHPSGPEIFPNSQPCEKDCWK
jgi:hypothetical protein